MKKFDWDSLLSNKNSEDSFTFFYHKIERLLDEMAPYKTLNKKEQSLGQRPWISGDILDQMRTRDNIHKLFLNEKNLAQRDILFKEYKKKRNEILSSIRKSRN